MKTFFASLLGTMLALFLFALGLLVVGFGFIGVIASLGNKPVSVPKGGYLVFDLTSNISDAPTRVDPFGLYEAIGDGDRPKELQLKSVTRALRSAAGDDRIAGLLLTGRMAPSGYGSSLAALKEVRVALQAFKESGKPVIAYLGQAGTREIYLGSVADEIVIDPYGQISMPGLASEPMFVAETLEKLGVGVQVARVGKYKSAVEMFTRSELGAESREQLQELLNDLWLTVRNDIAGSRQITPEALQALVDREGYLRPTVALEASLVTRIAYRDELISDLKKRTGKAAKEETFAQVSLPSYAKVARDRPAKVEAHEGTSKPRGRIAVLYAEGAIVEGEGAPSEVGGTRFARELRRLRQDPQVDAIVLRVNSPGGSATASEHILREMRLSKDAKPTVVSMGGYAASGGYWISAFGDRIFAEPSTITGSIGVFSVLFDVKRLARNLGIGFDLVKTGRFADLESISRPKTPEELGIFQRDADWIYQEFIARVAEGRKLSPERVEQIAQGRVWSGTDALEIGLIDELGGLDDAIRHAAERANLGDNYTVREYPRVKPFAETLAEVLEGMQSSVSQAGLLSRLAERIKREASLIEQFNDPRGLYARLALEIVIQ